MAETSILGNATAQFEAVCGGLPTKLKDMGEESRLRAIQTAKDLVSVLQTPDEFATQQTWAPLEIVGAAIASDLGIFRILAESKRPLSGAEVVAQSKGDAVLTLRSLRFSAAHALITQVSNDEYAANDRTRDYATETRTANVWTMLFCLRSYAALPFFLRDTNLQNSTDAYHCAWQDGWNTDKTFWGWLESQPEMARYFNEYMTAARSRFDDDDLSQVYPFKKLFADSAADEVLFVDIGGGFGQQCINLRKSLGSLDGRVILQDLPSVVKDRQIDGVEVMAMDMMKEQPVKDAKVYYFRGVLHDHSDEVCREFLTHVKQAMGPHSRLLIHEKLVAERNPSELVTKSDLLMMSVYAAMERSAFQMRQLLESIGLKALGQYGIGTSEWQIVEASL